jgi:hypothetical protein
MTDVHLLLVYDRRALKISHQHVFDDYQRAFDEYLALEEQHRADDSLEIVLLSSDSLESIKRTHGNYFRDSSANLFPDIDEMLESA